MLVETVIEDMAAAGLPVDENTLASLSFAHIRAGQVRHFYQPGCMPVCVCMLVCLSFAVGTKVGLFDEGLVVTLVLLPLLPPVYPQTLQGFQVYPRLAALPAQQSGKLLLTLLQVASLTNG